MTYRTIDLALMGIDSQRISMRKWRRERGLTLVSMACMLECKVDSLRRYELGQCPMHDVAERYAAFVKRWQKVPETQAKLAEVVHRQTLARSAAARARRLAVIASEREAQGET